MFILSLANIPICYPATCCERLAIKPNHEIREKIERQAADREEIMLANDVMSQGRQSLPQTPEFADAEHFSTHDVCAEHGEDDIKSRFPVMIHSDSISSYPINHTS